MPAGGQEHSGGEARSWARCWASPGSCGATARRGSGSGRAGRGAPSCCRPEGRSAAARWGTWLRSSTATTGKKGGSPSALGDEVADPPPAGHPVPFFPSISPQFAQTKGYWGGCCWVCLGEGGSRVCSACSPAPDLTSPFPVGAMGEKRVP